MEEDVGDESFLMDFPTATAEPVEAVTLTSSSSCSSQSASSSIMIYNPSYGTTFSLLKRNYFKANCDKTRQYLYCVSILSTFCSLPCIHYDQHFRNICFMEPKMSFLYRWTVQLCCHVFEITWVSKGMPTIIDWNNHGEFPRIDDPSGKREYLTLFHPIVGGPT